MNHAWCKDVSRDESVRQSEDRRSSRHLTLDECFLAVAIGATIIPKTASGSSAVEEPKSTAGDNEPWQKAILNDAVCIIVDGGDWGRGNNMDHGKLGAAVIWADKEINRLRAHVVELEQQAATLQKAVKEGVVEIERAMADSRGWRDKLRRQLPPTMQNCTIVFKECEFGHHWLTATNWAGHGCPWCEHDTLRARLAKMKAAPAASGLLTADEREVIKRVSEHLFETSQLEFTDIVTLDALLARKTPEVLLPTVFQHSSLGDPLVSLEQVKAALAAEGVKTKEAGR